MEISSLIPHIESLIFASDKPLTSAEITDLINQAFGFMEDKVVAEQVDAAIEGIVEKYATEFYPFEVRQSGGGWQFLTKKDFHKTVAQLNGEKFLKRLSAAALETLSIIAYKQPVTKGEIEAIRGVSSDYAVQKLLEKELIIISGRNEKMPGHPLVYATSKNFMDYFGINTPEDLPKIREVLADQVVEPTVISQGEVVEPSELLAVSDNGTLIEAQSGPEDDEPYVNGHSFGEKESGAEEATEETDAPVQDSQEEAQENPGEEEETPGSEPEKETPSDEPENEEDASDEQAGDEEPSA
jgi:segregation and condensation protein B